MTQRMRAPIIWAVIILALLAGAHMIVAHNGSATSVDTPVQYIH